MVGNILEGETKLFIGDEPIDSITVQDGLSFEIPDLEPLKAFDIGQEDGDKTGINIWQNGNLSLSFTIQDMNYPILEFYRRMVDRFRCEKKALYFALTHGYKIRVPFVADNDEEGYFELTLPSQLRKVLQVVKIIPQYKIYDRYGFRYIVRKSRLVRMKAFPFPLDELEAYTKKLKEYSIAEI